MNRRGLPVPEPVAARYRRQGRSYTADLLMWRIPDTRTLAECMREAPLPISTWVSIGRCIRRFHLAESAPTSTPITCCSMSRRRVADRFSSARAPVWSDGNLARLYRSRGRWRCRCRQTGLPR
jgi:3-deoxy-D-manno-octulosonic acid kinase